MTTQSHMKIRIDPDLKRDANIVLGELGYTQTDLVRAACNYVVDHRRLPSSRGGFFDSLAEWFTWKV